jgi:hypothetical protein
MLRQTMFKQIFEEPRYMVAAVGGMVAIQGFIFGSSGSEVAGWNVLCFGGRGFSEGLQRCSKCPGGEFSTGAGALTHLWPGYPLSSCSSAELDSVSPGGVRIVR